MPFVLRGKDDTNNPVLAELRGYGLTYGRLAYYSKVGGLTKFILLLARGICDGLDWYEYDGQRLAPYDPVTGQGHWVFHPGTLTRRKDPANPGTTGFNDPLQGRPTFFPELDFTFSGISYVEVRLPADLTAEGEEEPRQSQIRMRGLRVRDYNADGTEMVGPGNDSEGRPLWQVPGTATWLSFTCNPARHVADVIRLGKVDLQARNHWPSWSQFRARSGGGALGGIAWAQAGGDGLLGQYFNPTGLPATQGGNYGATDWFAAVALQRVDTVVNFNFGTTTPPGVGGNPLRAFGARWTGFVEAPEDGPLTFYSTHDDGVRLWVDGALVIDHWRGGGAVTMQGTTGALVKGQKYAIIFEYKQQGGPGEVKLEWGLSGGRAVVPQSHLYSSADASSAVRSVPRYECDLAHTAPVPAQTALENVLLFCPGVQWQYVNGKYKWLTDPAREPVYHFTADETQPAVGYLPSNIVRDSFSAQRRDPTLTPNFLRFSYRDKDTDLFDLRWDQIDRPERRRLQKGRDYSPGPLQLGVCRQSLAQRIVETQARLNIDLDIQVTLKGLPMCYRVAKGDIVRVTHNVPKWRVYGPVLLFMVVRETFDSSIDTADERSFVLRLHHPEYYSDTAHGPLQRFLGGGTTSRQEPPPPAAFVGLPQEVKTATADGRTISSIQGAVQFDQTYPHEQYAWVWWGRPGGSLQPAQRIRADRLSRQATYNLSPAEPGAHTLQVVAETALGRKWPEGHPTAGVTVQGDTTNPDPPPSGSITYDGAEALDVTWEDSPSANRSYYELRWADAADGGLGTLISSVVRRPYRLPLVSGKTRYDVRVYTVSSAGRRSLTYLPLGTDLPAVAGPAGYTLDFVDGTVIRHRIAAPVAGQTYDFSTNGTAAAVQGTRGLWDEADFAFTSGQRSFTRYARAVRYGVPSAWVSQTLTVTAPAAPVVAVDPDFQFPSSFVLRVTGPTDANLRKRIRATVVQLYADAGAATPVGQPMRFDGLTESVTINGRQVTRAQVWARAYFEDLFGGGTLSNIAGYTFTQFAGSDLGPGSIGDSHIDTSSSLARRITAQNAYPMMASGTLTWDGTTFTTGARVISIPVPRTVATAGYFNFGAAATPSTYNLSGVWAALVWRVQVGGAGGDADNHAYNAGTNKGWFVADYTTYTAATAASGRMDFVLAVRNNDTGSLHLWNNLVLKPTGQPIPAGGVLQNQSVTQLTLALSAVGPDQLQGGAVTAGKIADNAIDAISKFAGGLQPIKSVSVLPSPSDTTVPDTVLLLTDYKLYRRQGGVWTRAVDGADIVADSIFGNSMRAGTISAREIGAEAVRTAHLFVGNFDNLAEDPGFERAGAATTWQLGAGMAITTGGQQRSGTYYLNTVAAGERALNANYVDCAPGQQFYVEGFVRSTGGGNGGVCVAWYNVSRALLSVTNSTTLGPLDAAGYQMATLIATAPAGAAYARCGFFTPVGGIPGWFFDEIYFRRVMDGAIISDASIQYAKIAQAHLENVTINSALVSRAVIDWLAVREANIVDLSVVRAKIALAAIDYARIENAVLQTVQIGGASVQRAYIDWLGVREANIVDANITQAKIALLAVDQARIADAAINMAKVQTLDVGTYVAWNPVTQTGSGVRLDPSGLYINTPTAAVVMGVPLTVVGVRAVNAISQYLTWRGRDERTLDTTKRTFYGRVNTEYTREEDSVRWRCFCNFDGLVNPTSNTTDIHGDSLKWCRYEAFNKFGERVNYNYSTYTGRGIAVDTAHTRKYADPDQNEVSLKMQFWNAFGWTPDEDALWLLPDNSMSYSPPTYKSRALCPLELQATVRSSTEATLAWQWGGAARTVWARNLDAGGAWLDVTAACTGDRVSSCVVTGLQAGARYEFRVNDGTGNAGGNNSNVIYLRLPYALAPPARPAPSTPSGNPLSTTAVRFTWTRNASDNTAADYSLNGGAWTALAAADTVQFDVGGLAPSTTVTLRVRNRWGDGSTAESGTGSGTSAAQVVSNTNPSNLSLQSALVNTSNLARATFTWQVNGGSNPTLHVKRLSTGVTTDYNPTATSGSHTTPYNMPGGEDYEAWVTNADGTAPSNVWPFTAPEYVPPIHEVDPWCLAPETRVEIAGGSCTAEALLALHRLGGPLPQAVWQVPGGRRELVDIVAVTEGTAPGLWTVETDDGHALTCSPSHPVIAGPADTAGTPAADLRRGSPVLTRDGVSRVKRLRYVPGRARVIMLTLRGPEHRFWSDGIASHNAKPRDAV